MENKGQNKDEVKISKKSLYIGGAVFLGIVALVGGYFGFANKNGNPNLNPKADSLTTKVDSTALVKKDSVKTEDYEGEEYEPYGEFRIIANELALPDGQKLKFGDVVYKDYEKSSSSNNVIYLHNPRETPSTKSYPVSISENVMIDGYYFEDYKNKFSLSPYNTLPPQVKRLLMNEDGNYRNERRYFITQNADRAKTTLTSGDYDGDGVKDFAVVLDDNERQESRLMIIGSNKATKNVYIAFAESYYDKIKIKSFAKGASVYMNSDDFVKAPRDGVLIQTGGETWIVIYNKETQRFDYYKQVPAKAYVVEEEE